MNQIRMLRIKQVVRGSGLSRSSIYRLIKLGLFPKPIKIGITAVGWLASEIDQWIHDRKQASVLPDGSAEKCHSPCVVESATSMPSIAIRVMGRPVVGVEVPR